jgi:hypothetical protein
VKSDRTVQIQDQLAGPEPFIYLCRIITRHGAEMLRPGLKLLARFNPADPSELCISDENDRYIGHLAATSRVHFLDHETMVQRLGERSAIKADLEAPVRQALATVMQDRGHMREHNDRIIDKGTPEEIALDRIAKRQANEETKNANSLQEELDSALQNIRYEE